MNPELNNKKGNTKLVLKTLVVAAALLAVFFIYISTKPDSYNVKYTEVLKAPITTVFATVNDFKTWENWNPSMKKGADIEISYGDRTTGVGAEYSWESEKKGGGKMQTISLETNKTIHQKISFANQGESDVYWAFKEVTNGTEVTWAIKGELNLIEKAGFFVIGGADLMFMPMLVNGIRNLDSYTQKK